MYQTLVYEETNKRKANRVSLVLHIALVLLAFLVGCPHEPEKAADRQYSVAVNFQDIEFTREQSSNSTKSKAKSGKPKKKEDPVTEIKEKKVDQIEVKKPTPPKIPKPTPKTPKPTKPVISETTMEEAEIEAVEEESIEISEPELEPEPEPEPEPIPEPDPEPVNDTKPINNSKGKSNSSDSEKQGDKPAVTDGDGDGTGKGNDGDGPGSDAGGNDGDSGIGDGGIGTGKYDGSGDGIFGRAVIHVNRAQLARVMDGVAQGERGKIFVKTCVNRAGLVTYVELDELNTTIKTRSVLKAALTLVSDYKFEPKLSGAKEECGLVKVNIDKTEAIWGGE